MLLRFQRKIDSGDVMVRIVVILSLAAAACDVGALPGFGPDGGSGGGDGTMNVICENISANIPAGNHNPGMNCIVAGCHLAGNLGVNAPAYSYGGTLYKDVAGTQPFPGATIFVKRGATEKKIITADNGNFWMTPGAAGLDSPDNAMTGTTKASGCPDTTPMIGMLVQGGGACNNCHRNGGTTTPIHLP